MRELKYILILLTIFFYSCKKDLKSVELHNDLEYFNKVQLNDSFDVILQEGSAFEVKLEGDSKAIEGVVYFIEDSVLYISNDRRFKWLTPSKNRIKVYITSEPLKLVVANETCFVTTNTAITSDEFGLEFHSKANEANLELDCKVFHYWNNFPCGGKLTLSGHVDFLKIWNFAAVSVDAKSLQARQAIVENSSLGDCYISVSEKLDYAVKGTGNINLYGRPAEINQTEIGDSSGELVIH